MCGYICITQLNQTCHFKRRKQANFHSECNRHSTSNGSILHHVLHSICLLPFPIEQLFIMKWIVACHTGKYSCNRHIVKRKKETVTTTTKNEMGKKNAKKCDTRKKLTHTHMYTYIIQYTLSLKVWKSFFIPSYKMNDTHRHTQTERYKSQKNVKRNNRIFVFIKYQKKTHSYNIARNTKTALSHTQKWTVNEEYSIWSTINLAVHAKSTSITFHMLG